MRRFRIFYTLTARADLLSIGDRIREARGNAGADRFMAHVIATAEALQTMPRRHRVRRKLGSGIRATGFRKYMIFYRVEADTVSIVRVLYGARRITARLLRADAP